MYMNCVLGIVKCMSGGRATLDRKCAWTPNHISCQYTKSGKIAAAGAHPVIHCGALGQDFNSRAFVYLFSL